jgi:hypothetical protein
VLNVYLEFFSAEIFCLHFFFTFLNDKSISKNGENKSLGFFFLIENGKNRIVCTQLCMQAYGFEGTKLNENLKRKQAKLSQ